MTVNTDELVALKLKIFRTNENRHYELRFQNTTRYNAKLRY